MEVSGTLDASAPTGGHGGFIETSGERVRIADGTLVTTAAPQGQTGQWLIDPTDFNIAPSGGDITGAGLSSQLNSSNVTILSASGSASGAGDINVNDSVAWNSANSLTLSALHSINVNRPISNGGTGGVSLRADNTGLCIVGASRCGTINFGGTGHITVNGGPVDLYYNPIGSSKAGPGGPSYATPTNYSPRVTLNGGSALTAWMLVNDVTQLQAMQTNLGGDYALGNDIDASATSGWNGGAGFAPVGGPAFGPFAGRFDGGGHAISGLTIVRADSDYIGLFGAVAPGASVKNVGLTAANVKGSHAVGSLAGSSAGTVSNVHASGIVFGRAYYGGLIGSNDGGTVTAADSEASVFGESIYAGGLIGYNSGTVSDSHATGSVGSTENTVGGLVGYNDYGGTLTRVYATGGVRGGFSSGFVGGLVGQNNGTIADAYATGNASGNQFSSAIGGLVGYNLGSLSHVHASGNVIGGRQPINLGGLIGANEGVVSEAYATGEVSGAAAVFIGGLIGNNRGSVTSSYATGAVNVSDLFLDNGVSAGGLVGLNEFGGTLDRVFASGNVSGGRDGNAIGGLVGENSGAVSNAYATGRASGNSTVGGLVGVNRGTLTTSYSLGTVTGNEFVGGLVGNNQFGTVTYSYWDVDTSHQATSDGGIGLSDVKMKQPASFAGFDFANTWSIQKNKSYPQLRVFLSPSP